jgi:hypothetical protein
MEIKFSSKRGRASVNTTVDVDDLSTEDNLQEVFLHFMDFLISLGAEFPDELVDLMEDYNDDID